MATKDIANPSGAFVTTSDFRTGVDSDGKQVGLYQETFEAIANVAIAAGDVLTWVLPSATVPPKVTNAVATGGAGTFKSAYVFAGVAVRAAAIGNAVLVASKGFVQVNIGSGTAVAGDMAVLGASAGQADVIAAATGIVAGTFAGNVLGDFMGVKNTANLALIWLTQV